MRLTFFTLASLLALSACGPDPADKTTDTHASTGATTTATAGTDAPTTGMTGMTGNTGTTDTTGTTGMATATATATATGTTTAGTTDESTDTGVVTQACEKDADCMLAGGCCDCDGSPVGVSVPECDQNCKQSKCSELGIGAPVCRFGVCSVPRLVCDASLVGCDQPAPDCEPGTLPETQPACWTGRCIPVKNCDVVDSCDQCPEDWVCVQDVGFGRTPGVHCEPLPPGCDPAAPCACIGDQVCVGAFQMCINQPGGDITCECPNC